MTDEEKKVEKCECKCECCEKIAKFFFLTGAIFLGTLLALLVANSLTRPKFPPCPCHKGMHGMRPGIEKQIPPYFKHHGHHPKFEGKPNFKDFPKMPEKK